MVWGYMLGLRPNFYDFWNRHPDSQSQAPQRPSSQERHGKRGAKGPGGQPVPWGDKFPVRFLDLGCVTCGETILGDVQN